MAKDALDFDELYPGRFLKAGEFKGRDVTLTIAKVYLDELEGQKGKQVKGVISFRETPKELCLNRTNGEAIKAMFGRRLADWVGKRVTLYPKKIDSDLAEIAIRVRGSPDIPGDMTFTLALPRKKPREETLKFTGRAAPAKPQTATPQPSAPPPTPAPATDPEPTDEELEAAASAPPPDDIRF